MKVGLEIFCATHKMSIIHVVALHVHVFISSFELLFSCGMADGNARPMVLPRLNSGFACHIDVFVFRCPW